MKNKPIIFQQKLTSSKNNNAILIAHMYSTKLIKTIEYYILVKSINNNNNKIIILEE
jgi:hypothetical protein